MAASTAFIQPAPSSSNNSVKNSKKQILSSESISNGNIEHSDHDRSMLLMLIKDDKNIASPSNSNSSDSSKPEVQDSNMIAVDSSTEEETTIDEGIESIKENTENISSNKNNSSVDSLMTNLEISKVNQTLNSSTMDKNNKIKVKNARQSTGKLERITERLAKKQNGTLTTNFNSDNQTQVNHVQLTNNNDYTNDVDDEDMNIDSKVESNLKSLDLTQTDEMDEDDDGFRALGLMGNVAFLGDESFKCPVCGLKLDSQHTFTLHIRSHNPNDHSNTCSLCGKTLSSASSLDRHMLIHSGERPFKCSLCGMAFTTNGNMHRHMRTHGHGSIGYTPRGQKRRAKLLTQALEKAMAAAAAGEQVDFEAINKLKKSILESKVTPAPPPPTSTNLQKRSHHRQKQQQNSIGNTSIEEQILSTLAPNVSIEAAAAAAVAAAAAHNTSNNSNSNTHSHNILYKGLGKKTTGTKVSLKKKMNFSSSSSCSPSSTSSTSHCAPINHHSSSEMNLSNNSLLTSTSWSQSKTTNSHSHHKFISTCKIQPEKGRPGRKKKQARLSLPALASTNVIDSKSCNKSSMGNGSSSSLKSQSLSRCPICAHPLGSTTELHIHMMTYHVEERLFCNDCGMILDNYDTYTRHHCTASAATVMAALSQNPTLHSDLLFCSSNTSRMNFSSARTYAANLEMLREFSSANICLAPGQLANLNQAPTYICKEALSQSLIDLSQQTAKINCSQCNKKFVSNKELKQHLDTYCHECHFQCNSISTLQLHQFSHSFQKLNPQLNVDKMKLLKNAAAFSLLPTSNSTNNTSTTNNNHLISLALTAASMHQQHSSSKANPITSKSLDETASKAASSIASLTSMANMKSDLADIESILSIVHATTSSKDVKQSSGNVNHLRSPISPNRASDAGTDYTGAAQMNGGQATNQPDSPASADSAAAAVASSLISLSTSFNTEKQHYTKTDLNKQDKNSSAHPENENVQDDDDNDDDDDDDYDDTNNNNEDEEEDADDESNVNANPDLDEANLNKQTNDNNELDIDINHDNNNGINEKDDNDKNYDGVVSKLNGYRCDSCKISFKSINALRRHNRCHTAGGGYSHACHLCSYKSLDKSTLIRHLRTHNGERPFQCAICKYAFTTKANCERHVRKRHRKCKSTKDDQQNSLDGNLSSSSASTTNSSFAALCQVAPLNLSVRSN